MKRIQHHTAVVRWLNRSATWSVLALYGLSIARAFVPGLCASERLMAATGEHASVESARFAQCCQLGARGSNDEDGRPPLHNTVPHCAFCLLNCMPAEQPQAAPLPNEIFYAMPANDRAGIAPSLPIVLGPSAPRDPPVV